MSEEISQSRLEEILKLQFEQFKHVSAISVTAGGLFVAFRQTLAVDPQLFGVVLLTLDIAFTSSLIGMVAVTNRLKSNRLEKRTVQMPVLRLQEIATGTLITGIVLFFLYTIFLPTLVAYAIGVVALIFFAVRFIYLRLRSTAVNDDGPSSS